jgi:DNA-binding response OmpR family regulator
VDSERTVNVHVRRLREKVELDPGRPALILTVPGIGYRLVR